MTETDRREISAPLGGVERGVLEFPAGAALVAIRSDDEMGQLFRLLPGTPGPSLKATVDGGHVQFRYPRLFSGFRRSRPTSVVVNSRIPWRIEARRGLAKLTADLRQVQLEEVLITGGASHLDLRLGRPRGVVQIRMTAAHRVTVRRPEDAPVVLRIGKGAAKVVLDEMELGAVGGGLKTETPGAGKAEDRYEIEITSGAADVKVTGE